MNTLLVTVYIAELTLGANQSLQGRENEGHEEREAPRGESPEGHAGRWRRWGHWRRTRGMEVHQGLVLGPSREGRVVRF